MMEEAHMLAATTIPVDRKARNRQLPGNSPAARTAAAYRSG